MKNKHTWFCVLCWRKGDEISTHAAQVKTDMQIYEHMAQYMTGLVRPSNCPGDIRSYPTPPEKPKRKTQAPAVPSA